MFVFVGREDNVVDNSLKNLGGFFWSDNFPSPKRGGKKGYVRRGVVRGRFRQIQCPGLAGSACRLRGICRRAWLG